jgi:magnesium-dependent phosphatase 1
MSSNESNEIYPELTVYDLDACLWDQEMFEMSALPSQIVMGDLNGRGEGVIGVMSGRDKISLHKGSLISLQEHYEEKYSGMRVALASSACTPFAEQIGRASLKMLEVVPGVTVWDILMRDWDGCDVNQIGRQPPLSCDKSRTHFPFLREKTGIRYDRMLFFDDCNWGDHCSMVAQNCKEADTGKGPVTVRTPRGLGEREWRKGLKLYAHQRIEAK